MNLSFRQCTYADAEILRDFSRRTFFETFAHMNTAENMTIYLNKAFEADKLRTALMDGNSLFFFLYADEKLAGYLKLNEASAQTDIQDKQSLEIERIYVAKEFQGKNFGRCLMEKAVSIASQRKKRYVWLGVWEKNEKALRFYLRNGFYRIGIHAFMMGTERQTDYIMRKDL